MLLTNARDFGDKILYDESVEFKQNTFLEFKVSGTKAFVGFCSDKYAKKLIEGKGVTDISRQSSGHIVGINLDSGDRFIKGKWKECLDEIEKSNYTLGLLISGNDMLVVIDGFFKAVLINSVNTSELKGTWYAF